MKKLLYIADLSDVTPARMAVIIDSAKQLAEKEECQVSFVKGKLAFNDTHIEINEETSKDSLVGFETEGVSFNIVDYAEAKNQKDSYDKIVLVSSNENLTRAAFIDLGLEGNQNAHVLNFEQEDPMQLIRSLQDQIKLLYDNQTAMLNQVQDLKLRVMAFMNVLSEEDKNKAMAIYEAQKNLIGATVQKSVRFGELVSSIEGKASIQELLEKFEVDVKIEGISGRIAREYFRISGEEENEEYLAVLRPKEEIASNKNLFNAVVVALAQ